MLFTEAPATKAPAPEKPAAPKQDMIPTETVQKILQLSHPEVKPLSPVAPLPETRPTPASVKSVPVSMAVEEVKIPAWLAPLARETDAIPADTPSKTPRSPKRILPPQQLRKTRSLSKRMPSPRRFSTRCLVTSCWVLRQRSPQQATPVARKKACLLDLPQLAFSSSVAVHGTRSSPATPFRVCLRQNPQPRSHRPLRIHPRPQANLPFDQKPLPSGPAGPNSNQPPASKPLTPLPLSASSSAVNSTAIPAVSKETTSEPHNAPPVAAQPKKPVLGEVRLANSQRESRRELRARRGSAPSIDASQPSSGAPFTLSASHSKEPTAPLPIGGDVVSAKLLKSVPPVYPPAARSQRVGGDVKIDALIDVSGNVSTMKVISGPALLHQAAMSRPEAMEIRACETRRQPHSHALDRHRAVPPAVIATPRTLNLERERQSSRSLFFGNLPARRVPVLR